MEEKDIARFAERLWGKMNKEKRGRTLPFLLPGIFPRRINVDRINDIYKINRTGVWRIRIMNTEEGADQTRALCLIFFSLSDLVKLYIYDREIEKDRGAVRVNLSFWFWTKRIMLYVNLS